MKKMAKSIAVMGGGIVIIVAIAIGVTGRWPVGMVDGTPVTYLAFKDNFLTAERFYRSSLKMAGQDERVMMAKEVQRDLQRATMEGLVEGILIDRELEKKYAADDLQRLIDNKVNGVDVSSEEMKKATELLYGLTTDRFRELVLVPKAKQEILEGNLILQDGTFNDWLTDRKKEASISIFIPALYWDAGEVKIK